VLQRLDGHRRVDLVLAAQALRDHVAVRNVAISSGLMSGRAAIISSIDRVVARQTLKLLPRMRYARLSPV